MEAPKLIQTADDEYKVDAGEKNYYSIAHTIHETVTAQASILVNGQLKGSSLLSFHSVASTVPSQSSWKTFYFLLKWC